MSYVLTVIHPPASGAAFGEAVVSAARPSQLLAAELAIHQLTLEGVDRGEASRFAAHIWSESEEIGKEVHHEPTGLTFRIDPADNAPHPCPCGMGEPDACGRLVVPGEHAFAHEPDAFCLGCWSDTVNEGCLPANTAHPAASLSPEAWERVLDRVDAQLASEPRRCRHCSDQLDDSDPAGDIITGESFCGANPDSDRHEPEESPS